MANKKHGKKKDAKKSKGIFAAVDSIGDTITSVPSAVAETVDTAVHTTADVAQDMGGEASQIVSDVPRRIADTTQIVIEKVKPDHKNGKDKKKNKKDKKK